MMADSTAGGTYFSPRRSSGRMVTRWRSWMKERRILKVISPMPMTMSQRRVGDMGNGQVVVRK